MSNPTRVVIRALRVGSAMPMRGARCFTLACMAGSTGRWCMSEESDRFFSDSRLGTNANATVHPLRVLHSVAVATSCVQRTRQEQSQTDDALESSWYQTITNVERAGALSPMMDGSNSSLQARSPCTTAAALCLPGRHVGIPRLT